MAIRAGEGDIFRKFAENFYIIIPMETIKSNHLTVDISPVGAEMQSLREQATGCEYLWQGDPAYWHGRSPILFPIVGGLWNGECRIGGQPFRIPKHGFVRRREWSVSRKDDSSVAFTCRATREDRSVFPADYVLEVAYSVSGRKVSADFRVENAGEADMWFQIGGHPALNLPGFCEDEPLSGYWQLEGTPRSLLRAGEQGCTEPERVPVPLTPEGLVPVCKDTFAHEALIFDGHQLSAATLLDKSRRPVARVESSAPVWLFWSPQGVHCPFVCAEPWYGLCDSQHFDGDISQRPFINRLPAGATWTGGYSIETF